MNYINKLEMLGDTADEVDVAKMTLVLDNHGLSWDDVRGMDEREWETLLTECDSL